MRKSEKFTRRIWTKDSEVSLPNALDSKYPSGSKELKCQWLFPQKNRWKNELTGQEER
ncbi:hypothetical protein [Treponema sp.]|uniref:hypothetical protein n=1 Tax=Treponema sp. TaxID=166 RepID=UPI00257A0861|nr:hypothetical protein [Treponema sp.]